MVEGIGYWRIETAEDGNREPENLTPNVPLSDKLRRALLYRNCFIRRKHSEGKLALVKGVEDSTPLALVYVHSATVYKSV